MNRIFNEMDFRLSVVSRWSTIFTFRKASIAEHSFFVALIADRIARNWLGFKDQDAKLLYAINRRAMAHDSREAVSGDIPSPVKKYWDEDHFAGEHDAKFIDADGSAFCPPLAREVVKVADFIVAMMEMRYEMSFGNRSVYLHYVQLKVRFEEFCSSSQFCKTMFGLWQAEEELVFRDDFTSIPTEYK